MRAYKYARDSRLCSGVMARYQLKIAVKVLVRAVADSPVPPLLRYITVLRARSLRYDDDEPPELAGEKNPFNATDKVTAGSFVASAIRAHTSHFATIVHTAMARRRRAWTMHVVPSGKYSQPRTIL